MLDGQCDPKLLAAGIKRADRSTTLADRAATASRDEANNRPQRIDDLHARYPWISRFNIEYYIGVDGISMAMILLTTVLFFLSKIASWGIEKHVEEEQRSEEHTSELQSPVQ